MATKSANHVARLATSGRLRGRSAATASVAHKAALCLSVAAAAAVVGGLGLSSASAANIYWNGVDNNNSTLGWNDPGAWYNAATGTGVATVPGSGDTAIFGQTAVTTAQIVDLNANQMALGLSFAAAETGGVTLQNGTGTDTLTLGIGGISIAGGAGAVSINSAVALSGSQNWTNSSANVLSISGGITSSATSLTQTLTFNSSGATTISGIIGDGSTGGQFALNQAGTGTLTLSGASANTYSGLTTVTSGALILSKTAGVAAVPGNLAINAGANVWATANNQLGGANTVVSNGNGTAWGCFTLLGTTQTIAGLSNGNGTLMVADVTTSNTPTASPSNSGAGVLILTGSGNYSDNGDVWNAWGGGGTLALTVSMGSGGVQTLAGSQITYTGGTTVNSGTLRFDLTGRSGAISIGTVSVASGSILELYNTNTTVDNTYLNTASGFTVTGSGTINKTGAGYLDLYNGASIKNFTGTINIEAGTLASNTSDWGSSAGAMNVNVYSGANLDLRVGNIVINNLAGYGTVGSTYSQSLVLSVGNNNGTSIFNGVIQNSLALPSYTAGGIIGMTKNGTGTLTLSGADTYTGGTTVNAGALIATTGSALGSGFLKVNGGSFAYEPSTAGPLALGSGIITLTSGITIGGAVGGASGSAITSTGTAASVTGDTFTVNVYGVPGAVITNGANNLISVGASSNLAAGTFTLGKIYDATNFTVSGGLTKSATAVSVSVTGVAALANEYWNGGYSGGNNVWALSDGSTSSNWVTSQTGGATSLIPGPAATVTFSANGATNQGSMVLGANMSIGGLVINDITPISLNADGNTLTIGSGGITINTTSGNPNVTLGAAISLGASQVWTNSSTNALTVSGNINTGANTLTSAGGGNFAISGAISGTGALTLSGAGTATLTGMNNYSGGTNIQSGTLVLGTASGTTTGSLLSSSAVTLGNAATNGLFQLGDADNPVNQTIASLTTSGSGTTNAVVGGNSAVSTLTIANTGAVAYSGKLGGASANQNNLALTVNGSATAAFTLNATVANTYTGGTTVTSGALILSGTAGVATIPGNLTINGGTSNVGNVWATANNQFGLVTNTILSGAQSPGLGSFTLLGTTQTIAGLSVSTTNGLMIANSTTSSGTPSVNNNSTGTLILTGSGNYTYNGYLWDQWNVTAGTGKLALTLNMGAGGVQTLGGTSITYTGATTLTSGELILAGATGFASPTSINSGTTLSFRSSGVGGSNINYSSTADTIALNNGGTLEDGSVSGYIVMDGAVTSSGTTTINLTSPTLSVSNEGFYIDSGLKGTGTVTINATNATNAVELRNNSTTFSGTLIVNGIASTTVNAGSGIGVGGCTTGLSNADITLNGTMELLNQGIGWANTASGAFEMGALNGTGVMVANYTSAGTTTVTLGNTNNNGSFSGIIANGTGNTLSLTKIGTGTQTFSGANTYSGATIINAGTLRAGMATLGGVSPTSGPLGVNSAVTVKGGATLDLNGFNETIGSFTDSAGSGGTITSSAAGAVTLITGGLNTSTSFAGNIQNGSGTVSLNKIGTGTQTLSGTNSYTGTTTVSAGAVQFTNEVSLYNNTPASWTATNLTVASGAMAAFNVGGSGQFTASDILTLSGLGTTTTNGFANGSTLGLDTTGAGGNFTYSNVIANPNGGANVLGLTKLGTGSLTLNVANTYTGATTVTNGVLILSAPTGTTAVPGNLVINGGTGSLGNVWATANNELGGTNTVLSGAQSPGLGSFTLLGTTQTIAGLNVATANGVMIANSTTGSGNPSANNTSTGTLILSGSGNYAYAGYLWDNWSSGAGNTGGHLALTVNLGSSATQTLSGANITYTGATALNTGTLTLQDTTAFASAITVGGSGTLISDRTSLGFANRSPILGSAITGSGIIDINNGGLGMAGGWTYIGVAGGLNFSGTININSGVFARDNTSLNNITGTATVNMASGTVFGAGRGGNSTIGALNGPAGTEVSTLWLGTNAGSITVGNGDGSGSFAGTIDGNGTNATDGSQEGGILSFIKEGAGTQTLSGANTFAGTTLVSAGTLALSNNLALQNSTLSTAGAGIITLNVTAPTIGGITGSTALASEIVTGYGGVTTLTLNPAAGIVDSYFGAIADGHAGMNLTKSGAGFQTLSGVNTYTGVTTVSAGTLQFTNEVSLYNDTPASWTNTNIVVANGATAAFNVGGTGQFTVSDIAGFLALATTTTNGFANGSTIGLDTTNATGGNFTYPNAITNTNGGANTLGLTKLGTGTLTLPVTNSYGGTTTVSNGGLILSAPANTTSVPNNLVINGTSSQGNVWMTANNQFGGANTIVSSTNAVNNWAAFTLLGTTQTIAGLSNAAGGLLIGNTTVSSGTSSPTNSGTGTIVLVGSGSYADAGWMQNAWGGGGGTIALTLNMGSGGTQTLSGSSIAYTGATTINSGTLALSNTTGFVTSPISVANGATLLFNNTSATGATGGPVALSGALNYNTLVTSGNSYWTWNSPVTISATTATIGITDGAGAPAAGSDLFLDGGLTGSANFTLTSNTNGVGLVLRDNNSTYSGTMTIAGHASATPTDNTGGGLDVASATTANNSLASASLIVNGTLELGNNASGMGWAVTNESPTMTFSMNGLAGTGVVVGNWNTASTTGASSTLTLSVGNKNGGGAFSGVIANGTADTLSFVKNGTGTQTLSGLSTYTGATTVNAGTLLLNLATNPTGVLSGSSALVMGGGTLNVTGASSGASNQTVASLALAAGTTSNIVLTPGASGTTTLTITSPTVTTGANAAVNFNLSAGTTNATTSTLGNTIVAWSPTGVTAGNIIGSAYTVTDAGGTGFATVSGGDVVRLPSAGIAGLPASGAVSGTSYVLNLNSTGTGGLNLTEAATQSASGSVNLTVDTTAIAGTFALGSTTLNTTGITISGPNTFAVSGSTSSALGASGSMLYLHNYNAALLTLGAPIGGAAGGLTVDGPGTTALTGASTYTGGTNIQNGTVILGTLAGSTTGSLAATGAVTLGTLTTSGIFQLGDAGNPVNQTIASLTTSGTGTANAVVGGNSAVSTLTINNASADNFAGTLGGTGTIPNSLALTKTGAGTLTLGGTSANTYTGTTALYNGIVDLAKPSGVAAITDPIVMGLGDTNQPKLFTLATNQFASGVTITTQNANGNYTWFALSGFNQTLAGIVSGTSSTQGSGVFENYGSSIGGPVPAGPATLTLNGGGNYVFDGYLRDTDSGGNSTYALGLTLSGTGTQTVASTNVAYTGPTMINSGTLVLTNTPSFSSPITLNSSGTLVFSNTANGNNSAAAGTINLNGGALNYTTAGNFYSLLLGSVTANATTTINLTAGGVNNAGLFLNGGLQGSAAVTIQSNSNGVGLILAAANNTYTGSLTVNGTASTISGTGGGIAIGNLGTELSSATFTVNGTMELGNSASGMGWADNQGAGAVPGTTFSIDALNGTGDIVANMSAAGSTRTLSVGNNNGSGSFSGTIANGTLDTLSFTKAGTGAQELSGANFTYGGTTTLANGTLKLTNTTGFNSANIALSAGNAVALQLNATSNWTLSKPITGGSSSASVSQIGSSVVTVGNISTYTGATTIASGTLRLGHLAILSGLSAGAQSALTVQLDASGLSGGAITSWANPDSAGNFIAGTNGTGGTIQGGGAAFNGLNVVHFNGSQILYNTAVNSANVSIFYVGAMDGTANARLVGGYSNNNLMGYWSGKQDTSYGGSFYGTGGTTATVTATTATHLYEETVSSAGAASLYSNGTLLGTGTSESTPNGLTLGGYSSGNGSEDSQASIGEVLVFSSVLSTADRQLVESYLDNKWFGVANGYSSFASNLLPTGTAISITGTGTFDLNSVNQTIGSLSSSIAGSSVTLGTATLTTGTDGTNTTFAGNISGTGGALTKTGAGTFTLTGTNSYTGPTTLNAGGGILQIAGGGSLGTSGTYAAAISIGSSATLEYSSTAAQTFSGPISGNGALLKDTSASALTLSGANSYSGGTTLSAGTLVVGISNAVGTGAFGPSTAGVTLGNAATTTNNSAVILLNAGFTVANPITVANQATSGGYTIAGSNISGTSFYTGSITLNQPVTLAAATGGTVDFNTGVWTTNNNAITIGSSGNAGTVEIDNTLGTSGGIAVNYGTLALDTALTGSSSNITVASGATLSGTGSVGGTTSVTSGTIGGSGLTLTGLTTFNDTGNILSGTETATVAVAAGAGVSQSGTLTGNVSLTNGASTNFTGSGTVGTITLNGGGNAISGNPTLTTSGVMVNGVGNTISTGTVIGNANFGSGATLAVNGALTGNATVGNGTLSGTGSVSGATSVTGGSINGSGLTLTGITTFNSTGNTLSGTVISTNGVTLASGAALANNGALTGNMTVGNGTLSGTGSVSGTTSVTGGSINGSGLTLTGVTTFNSTGNTLSGTVTATNGVSVATSGSLSLTGTLTGNITVNSSATLDVSGQAATIGSLNLSAGSLNLGINSNTAALLTINGTFTLGGAINVLTTGGTLTNGVYELASYTSKSGTLNPGTLPANYGLVATGSQLDLIHLGTIGTITGTPSASAIITGGSTPFTFTVQNNAPTGGASLNFTAAGGANTTGSVGSTAVAANSTSGAISGLTFNGTTVGAAQTGSFTVADSNASNSPQLGSVTVDVYGHASSSFTGGTLALGNLHTDGTGATAATLAVNNASGFRINLKGTATPANGFSVTGVSGIVQGTSSTISAILPAALTAGALSQPISYQLADDSTLSGAANVGSAQTVTITGTVWNYAAPNIATTSFNLGLIHVGGSFTPAALTVSNTAASGLSEGLDAAIGTTTGGASGSGVITNLAAGAAANTSSLTVTASGVTPAVINGTVAVTVASDGTGTSGLDNTPLAPQTINITGNVFSGNATWVAGGTTSWGTGGNWTDANGIHAAPGTFAGFGNTDTATFGNASNTAQSVTLDAATPSLASVAFTANDGTAYTISQGAGVNSLTLNNGASPATITDSGSGASHAINVPLSLNSNLAVTITNAGERISLGGNIAESGGSRSLSLGGAGALALTGANSYTGATTITGGTLLVNNTSGSGTGFGSVTITGGRLAGVGTIGNNPGSPVSINGGALSPGSGAASVDPDNAVGVLNTGDVTLISGAYNWTLNSGAPSTGTGQDELVSTGTLAINSTSGSPFTIAIIRTAGEAWDTIPANTTFVVANASSITLNNGATTITAGNLASNQAAIASDFMVSDNTAPGSPKETWTAEVEPGAGGTWNVDVQVATTPEPGSLGLLGIASLGLLRRRRRR